MKMSLVNAPLSRVKRFWFFLARLKRESCAGVLCRVVVVVGSLHLILLLSPPSCSACHRFLHFVDLNE
jgi:hypothetical protein